jgi:hypothetical protein
LCPNLLTQKVMQFFISTFIIMLICIIALLQDKSYDNGVILPRSQNNFPDRKRKQLTKCNNVSHPVLKVSPHLLIDKNESQTKVFAALLTEKLINPSTSAKTTAVSVKNSLPVNLNTKKNTDPTNIFCFRCDLNFFAPAKSYFDLPFTELQDQQMTISAP